MNATCLDHMLELRNQCSPRSHAETHSSIDRAFTRKVAKYEFKEVVVASFFISSGTSNHFRDKNFNRASISRLQLSFVPEENFTGSYATNCSQF